MFSTGQGLRLFQAVVLQSRQIRFDIFLVLPDKVKGRLDDLSINGKPWPESASELYRPSDLACGRSSCQLFADRRGVA
jgi:hypothetical protein